jgi:hypothetical protein
MAGMIFFTDNCQDHSTDDGYQFEFFCRRCGNGYTSSFQHPVTGFGGRMLRLGGDLPGSAVGEKAQQLGPPRPRIRRNIAVTRNKSLLTAGRITAQGQISALLREFCDVAPTPGWPRRAAGR